MNREWADFISLKASSPKREMLKLSKEYFFPALEK